MLHEIITEKNLYARLYRVPNDITTGKLASLGWFKVAPTPNCMGTTNGGRLCLDKLYGFLERETGLIIKGNKYLLVGDFGYSKQYLT